MSLIGRQMDELSAVEQAKKAIRHTLQRIHDEPVIGWYINLGNQSFALMTEAYATLTGGDLEEISKRFACPNAKNPAEPEGEDEAPEDKLPADSVVLDLMTSSDVVDFLELLPPVDRMELMQQLLEKFCASCGAHYLVKFGPCDCHARRRNLRMTA